MIGSRTKLKLVTDNTVAVPAVIKAMLDGPHNYIWIESNLLLPDLHGLVHQGSEPGSEPDPDVHHPPVPPLDADVQEEVPHSQAPQDALRTGQLEGDGERPLEPRVCQIDHGESQQVVHLLLA